MQERLELDEHEKPVTDLDITSIPEESVTHILLSHISEAESIVTELIHMLIDNSFTPINKKKFTNSVLKMFVDNILDQYETELLIDFILEMPVPYPDTIQYPATCPWTYPSPWTVTPTQPYYTTPYYTTTSTPEK